MLKYNVNLHNKTILVTGAAGFIGANLIKRLYNEYEDIRVIGIDNLNDYYDVKIKESRLNELEKKSTFLFFKGTIAEKKFVKNISPKLL